MNLSPDQPDPPNARPLSMAPMVELVTHGPRPADQWLATTPSSVGPLIVSQSPGTILLDLFVACAIFAAVLLGLEFLCAVAFGGGFVGPPPSGWVLVGQRAVLSLSFGLVLLGLLHKNGQSVASIGVRADGSFRALLWGVLAYATVFGYVLGVTLLVSVFWPGILETMQQAQERNVERLPEMGPALAAVFALTVAISEELLFRGFIITRLRGLMRSWTASVLITSAVFAGLHIPQGWLPVALIFGLSIILGFWMIWRGNLLVPIVAHMLFDFTSIMWMNEVVR